MFVVEKWRSFVELVTQGTRYLVFSSIHLHWSTQGQKSLSDTRAFLFVSKVCQIIRFFLSFYIGQQIFESSNEFQALEGKQNPKFLPKFIIFAEELTADLELGIRYDVPGLQTNNYFQAWNVKRWVSSTGAKMCHQELSSFQMPPSISALYAELGYVRRCNCYFVMLPDTLGQPLYFMRHYCTHVLRHIWSSTWYCEIFINSTFVVL